MNYVSNNFKMVVVITSGYFDPIHEGHIEYLELAKELYKNSRLIVIVNNTEQAILKKGSEFMKFRGRLKIVSALGCVDEVFPSIDQDPSVCKSIEQICKNYNCDVVFAKGGDRFSHEIPEAKICERYNVKIIDSLGNKIESSSELVSRANDYKLIKKLNELGTGTNLK